MQFARPPLFGTKREVLLFLLACGVIFVYALLIHANDYADLTRFDTYETHAKVLAQYEKSENDKTYQVFKLQTREGLKLYTTKSKSYRDLENKTVRLTFWTSKIDFLGYLTSFYAYTHFHEEIEENSLKSRLEHSLASLHKNPDVAAIYQALYSAKPLPAEMQTTLSTLGISHLLAISGFHLGVLSAVLFFLARPAYRFFQRRYFPYAHANRDTFVFVACCLFFYMVFLDTPPSLLRAFGMLVVGFVLYDRGFEIVSMQTLFCTVVLLLSLFPKLFFALGFWLSAAGVFYIFLFLLYFKHKAKLWQFFVLPFWVYALMLPYSLYFFGNFGVYHPLSIVWTVLFTLFYPLSIALHAIGFGTVFDPLLEMLLSLGKNGDTVVLEAPLFLLHLVLSFGALKSKLLGYLLLLYGGAVFLYALSAL